jgi:hypothetical protein
MAFYEFDQNNTGGSFDVDDKLCRRLWIEADSESEAEAKAFNMGVYYNGCDDERDCPCCGDRWYSPSVMKQFPYKYSDKTTFQSIDDYAQYMADNYGWTVPDIRIFYKDGNVKEIFRNKAD